MRSLPHVCYHGAQQMRNAFVNAHLQHLGINQQEPYVARISLVKQAQDHCIDAHRLARTSGARHQAVRHFGQVRHHRMACDVFAQAHREQTPGFVVNL